MEFRSWWDGADPGPNWVIVPGNYMPQPNPANPPANPSPSPEMKVIFQRSEFGDKYRNMPFTTTPVVTPNLVTFEATWGVVNGLDVREINIMLDTRPPVTQWRRRGYRYEVRMRTPQSGGWVSWDPRVVPR